MTKTDLKISNKDEAYITIGCDESVSYELRDHFTFVVPGAYFTPKYKAKVWDGKIRLWDPRTKHLYRGLLNEVISFCKEREYTYSYEDKPKCLELTQDEVARFIKELNPKYIPRDYQIEGFTQSISKRRSLLLSPTASGKSLIIYMIIHYLLKTEKKGLIIVPTISLVEQMYTDFQDYSEKNKWDVENNIHKIYQGQEKDTKKSITISTWQSLFKQPKEFFKDFDFVIGDEAHNFQAKSLTYIMTSLVNAKYRIGTTGTLSGAKTHRLVLEGLFGPVNKVVTTKELMEKKHLAEFQIKAILLKHSNTNCLAAKNFTYQQEIEYLVLNEQRNIFISKLALSLEGNTLLLYQYVEKHGQILYDIINNRQAGRKVFFIHGGVDVDIREETRRIVEKEKNAIIVASFGVFSQGVNIKNLHNLIFASPSKSRIRNLQSIGRGLRTSETKTSAVLYDISDDLRWKRKENYTLKHFLLRVQLYLEEKFQYKIYKINLRES